MQAARAAGVKAVGVSWGVFDRASLEAERPDQMVASIGELARVLGV